jgi:hypothetical protein
MIRQLYASSILHALPAAAREALTVFHVPDAQRLPEWRSVRLKAG